MSAGIGASASIIYQDEASIIYKYGAYNLNKPEFRNENHIKDGRIIILIKCLDECVSGEIYKNIANKSIIIENCSNCWWKCQVNDDLKFDVMVIKLLVKLLKLYKENGIMPKRIYYDA